MAESSTSEIIFGVPDNVDEGEELHCSHAVADNDTGETLHIPVKFANGTVMYGMVDTGS